MYVTEIHNLTISLIPKLKKNTIDKIILLRLF